MAINRVFICVCVMGMTACTTVDFTQLKQSEDVLSDSVIDEAVSLHTHFKQQGWGARQNSKQLKMVSDMLMNGFGYDDFADSEALKDDSYEQQIKTLPEIERDIQQAHVYIENITESAQTCIDDSENVQMRKILVRLEQALLISKEAESMFRMALKKIEGQSDNAVFQTFQKSIDDLRAITDTYGTEVRANKMLQLSQG